MDFRGRFNRYYAQPEFCARGGRNAADRHVVQTIQVNSTAVQVETADVQLKNVIGASELEELPTLGRDAANCRKPRLA